MGFKVFTDKTDAEKIAVMQGFLSGQAVEQTDIMMRGHWLRVDTPLWNWVSLDYRLAGEDEK